MKVEVTTTVRSNHIERKTSEIKAAAREATWRAAQSMLRLAQSRVHRARRDRDEGKTVYDSLQVVGRKGDETLEVGSVDAHKGRPVALFLENGTVRSHAYPYLRPAATLGAQTLAEEAKAGIRAAANAD